MHIDTFISLSKSANDIGCENYQILTFVFSLFLSYYSSLIPKSY